MKYVPIFPHGDTILVGILLTSRYFAGSFFTSSGLCCENDINWISFHSAYDFGYLIKMMHIDQLPEDEPKFRELLHKYFPSLYDIKYLVNHVSRTLKVNNSQDLTPEALSIVNGLITAKGGLQTIADELHVHRIGTAHCAGSDAQLTGKYIQNRSALLPRY